ncbi:RDD family protein [Actinoplanes sichuanensis]|uniref:RDD family protein n=1 Tax=Actinoplanes sichuanensis TaxID=512349 RepID=A0ABW4AKJ2_9ACTN|nr:RDD family protein [Actinoplanes sichuanensis]
MNPYAGLVSRLAAYVLDALIVSVMAGVATLTFALVASVLGSEGRELAKIVLSTYVVFLPTLMALYCSGFWILAGRTPGQLVFGLRVVNRDGRSPRLVAGLVRGLLLAYLPILALWLLFDRRHQGLHDKLARTTVVRSSPREDEASGTSPIAPSSGADHGSRGRVPTT